MFSFKKFLFVSSALTFASFSGAAHAAFSDWADMTYGQESKGAGGYEAINGGSVKVGQGSSAVGRYQILYSNWERMGYVQGSNWENAVFTDKAKAYGVSSVDDLLKTGGGHSMQDAMAVELASSMWSELGSSATSSIGQTYHGVTINEAGMLGGTWFLGAGGMNQWASSGFSVDGLRNLPNIQAILDQNHMDSVEELHAYMMGRMADFENVDISEITNGSFTPGGGEYALESFVECETEISQAMYDEGAAYVDQMVAAAQDANTGFSPLEETFGQMSCIDFAFTGGMDILFSPPSLTSIASQVSDTACARVNSMVAEATGGMSQKLQEFSGAVSDAGAVGFGPFGSFGVETKYNPNTTGVNIGLGDGSSAGGTSPGLPGSSYGGNGTFNPQDGAFSSLFEQAT